MPFGDEDREAAEADALLGITPDSANVGAQPPGPPPSSDAPGDSTEPHRATGAGESESDSPEPLPEFDPRVREDFEGLLFLGYLRHEFTWIGHQFTIRTLRIGEILEVGMVHKPYVGSLAEVKAYQAAVVAACVVQVDGRPVALPITDDPADTELANKFAYILRSWFPVVLDAIYDEYQALEGRVEQVIEAMGKASGWTGSTRTLSGASV